jgi:hypothetical protein
MGNFPVPLSQEVGFKNLKLGVKSVSRVWLRLVAKVTTGFSAEASGWPISF